MDRIIVNLIASDTFLLAILYSSLLIQPVNEGIIDEHTADASATGTLVSTLYFVEKIPQCSAFTSDKPFVSIT